MLVVQPIRSLAFLPRGLVRRRFLGLATCRSASALASPPRARKRYGRPALAAVGVVSAIVAVSACLEDGPDEDALPREYDVLSLKDYWHSRPWAVRRRCAEVFRELFMIILKSVIDWQLGTGFFGSEMECRHRASELREVLVRLGPAFIKIGQALAIRPDLIPSAVLKELQRLCDDCPPIPWEAARTTLEQELGKDWESYFEIEGAVREPIAAASLGQVYRWKLRSNGNFVAVKVQRPHITHAIALDIHILRALAHVVHACVQRISRNKTDHVALVDTWARGSWGELDYEAEAQNQEQFRKDLLRLFPSTVYVPLVHHALTRKRILVTEWITGPRLCDCSPRVVKELCPIGVECFLAQLLDLGLFHSDPHPGNLLVSEGKLVLLDFGLVAKIENLDLHHHATACVNLINGDYEALLDDFVALGFLPVDFSKELVLPAMRHVIEQGMISGGDLKRRKKNFQAISDDLSDIFFEMPFSVPEYFALVTRALATLEGIALLGDPEFDIFWAAYPFALSRASSKLGVAKTSKLLSAAAARAAQELTAPQRAEFAASRARKNTDAN